MMKVKDFQEKISDYAGKYQDWKKLVDDFNENNQSENRSLPEMINSFLDEEYEVYFNARQEECDAIRASFSINRVFENLLLDYVRKTTINLRSTKDVKWLERGLVAVSLENSGIDYRDTLFSLNDLYKAAEDIGIDPNPYFRKLPPLPARKSRAEARLP